MVGVPRSKGCSLCLRRAVRCDEVRPSCGQCRRGGRQCPGYHRAMIFVDEGPKLLRKRKSAVPASEDHKPNISKLDHTMLVCKGPVSPQLEQLQLLSVCVSTMFPMAPTRTSYLGSWLWHLPPRLGQSKTLDYASRSLVLAFYSRENQALRHYAQQAYGKALCCLRIALADTKAVISAETLAAALLLAYYESFANVGQAWVRHAGGAGRLLQIRGAKRCCDSAFEYFMFLACRGSLIAEALLSGTPSFLETPEWQSLPADEVKYPMIPNPVELSHTFFILAARLPGVLHRAKAPGCNPLEARSEASTLRTEFMNWFKDYTGYDNGARQPVMTPAPSDFPAGPFENVFLYYDTASATMIMTYYAYLILLNQQIIRLEVQEKAVNRPPSATKENLELVRWICMSVYYCAWLAGYCGTSALTTVLPIARSIAPPEYQEWMAQW